ncbi:hypothetical protein VNO77_07719 [Canavalia gladiata]|uniref:Sucrose phosphatase-like domain-containing protein n=1 Tax=Canavalia gladiata TaxID=3824 RepID=A0AAN9M7V0_CANGL
MGFLSFFSPGLLFEGFITTSRKRKGGGSSRLPFFWARRREKLGTIRDRYELTEPLVKAGRKHGSRVKIKSLILSSKLNLDSPYVLTWTEPNWHGDSFSDFCSLSDCDKSKFTLKVSIKRKKIKGTPFTDTKEEAAMNLDPIVVLTTRSIHLDFHFILFPKLSWELDIMDQLKSLPRLVSVSDLDHTMVDHHDTENSSLFRFNALWETHYRNDPLLAFSAGRSPTLYQQLRKKKPMINS